MIIPFITLFFDFRETKSISNIEHVLSGVPKMIDFISKKRKRKKAYNQTRFVFYIRWDATM